jgi:hypothetical protein
LYSIRFFTFSLSKFKYSSQQHVFHNTPLCEINPDDYCKVGSQIPKISAEIDEGARKFCSINTAARFVRPDLVVHQRIADTKKVLMQLPSLYR